MANAGEMNQQPQEQERQDQDPNEPDEEVKNMTLLPGEVLRTLGMKTVNELLVESKLRYTADGKRLHPGQTVQMAAVVFTATAATIDELPLTRPVTNYSTHYCKPVHGIIYEVSKDSRLIGTARVIRTGWE